MKKQRPGAKKTSVTLNEIQWSSVMFALQEVSQYARDPKLVKTLYRAKRAIRKAAFQ